MDAVLVQLPFEAVTVYVVLAVGITITVAPDCPPGFQAYVVPPLAVSVAAFPEQIVFPEAVTDGFGTGVTVMFEDAEAVHPFAAVTVTV